MKRRKQNLKRREIEKVSFWPRPRHGQVVIEYTVVFALIAVVTAIVTAAFFSRICRSQDGNSSAFERYYKAIEQRIIR